jgi:hypothetical protein
VRSTTLLTVFFGLVVAGCGGSAAPPDAPAASQHPAARGPSPQVLIDRTKVKTDLAALRSAIRTHRGIHGAPPPATELEALDTHYEVGTEYDYDETAGTLRSRTHPSL